MELLVMDMKWQTARGEVRIIWIPISALLPSDNGVLGTINLPETKFLFKLEKSNSVFPTELLEG